jgi:hypothetical protein
MGRGTVKDKALRAAGRFSLVTQSEAVPYQYVTAEGPIVGDDAPPTREQALRIAGRYLSEPQARAYVDSALDENALLVRMKPEKWLSNDQRKA